MDSDTSQNLEQEIADMQARENALRNDNHPSGFAQAMKDKKALVEKVKRF